MIIINLYFVIITLNIITHNLIYYKGEIILCHSIKHYERKNNTSNYEIRWNLKGVIALKDGMLFTLPLIIMDLLFLLIAQFLMQPFT